MQELLDVLPKWEDYITDEHLHKRMARASLLNCRNGDEINNRTIKLFNHLVLIGQTHEEFAFEPQNYREDKDFEDDANFLESAYDKGTRAITIRAALNVLLELKADQQIEEAQYLVDTKRGDLPASLVKALLGIRGIVDKSNSK